MCISLQNDDDWLNPDEEKKDYSGLKIGTLKIEEKDNKEPEEEHEINEEGERVPVKKSGDVWAQKRNEQNASKGKSNRPFDTELDVQGDTSHCFKPPIDSH